MSWKHTHAGSTFDNCIMTLTFDFRVSPCWATATQCICLPSLLLIAQAIFLLERGHSHWVTDTVDHPGSTATGMGNERPDFWWLAIATIHVLNCLPQHVTLTFSVPVFRACLVLLTVLSKFCRMLAGSNCCYFRHFGGALTLLVERQEGYLACKKTEWWGVGVVFCLGQGADLHMDQLMSRPLTISRFNKSRFVLPFWYQFTQVVLDKGRLNRCVVIIHHLFFKVLQVVLIRWNLVMHNGVMPALK